MYKSKYISINVKVESSISYDWSQFVGRALRLQGFWSNVYPITLQGFCPRLLPVSLVAVQDRWGYRLEFIVADVEAEVDDVGEHLVEAQGETVDVGVPDG